MTNWKEKLKGPYAISEGLSFEHFGELVKSIQESRKFGRTSVMNGNGQSFHFILYDDLSFRITDSQLELFPT